MPEEEPYDAGNPAHVRRRIKASKQWDEQRVEVIIALMSTEPGRRWVHELLLASRVGQNPFAAESTHTTAFNCGQLNQGQMLMAQVMNASVPLYMLMMEEANRPQEPETEDNA